VIDFRYHALSLVAVFLALGIGIVLGATLGDSLVSEASRDVRSSLRGDVIEAREAARDSNARLVDRDRALTAAFPHIAGGRLDDKRVAIVSSGALPQDVESNTRAAIKDAGGEVDSVSRFAAEPDLAELREQLGGRYERLGTSAKGLRSLGRRLGRALVRGGEDGAARRLEDAESDAFSGDFEGADAVVYYRTADERDDEAKAFESALIEGLRSTGLPVVGVETTDTDPSRVPFYVNAALSTVDDVDIPPGRIALVLTLTGSEGSYGYKQTADAPLPPPRDGG
jgi:hypothetical protein